MVFHTRNLKMWAVCCGERKKVWESACGHKNCYNDMEDWWGQRGKGNKTTFHLLFIGTSPWNKLFIGCKFCFRWNWVIHQKRLTFMQPGGWELWAKLSGRVNISFISAIQTPFELGLYKGYLLIILLTWKENNREKTQKIQSFILPLAKQLLAEP